jgi:hypothetical protein
MRQATGAHVLPEHTICHIQPVLQLWSSFIGWICCMSQNVTNMLR